MEDKTSVLIFAHEPPIKGPKKPGVYTERAKQAGLKGSERVPYNQFLPNSKFLFELARRLPKDAKIAITAGHLHVPREVVQTGTKYVKFNKESEAKMRLFGLGGKIDKEKYETNEGGRKTFDLYYLPEGEVGTFEIDDGNIKYKKLTQDKE